MYDKERHGRPASLDKHKWGKLGRDLRKQQKTLGYTQNLWDGKLSAHYLQSHYGIKAGVRQCQQIFHKLGFRRRKPRPVIAQADPSVQEAFKKNFKSWQKTE